MKCGVCGKYIYYNSQRCNSCKYTVGTIKPKYRAQENHPTFTGGSQRRWQVEMDIQKRKDRGDKDFIYPGRKVHEDLRPRVD